MKFFNKTLLIILAGLFLGSTFLVGLIVLIDKAKNPEQISGYGTFRSCSDLASYINENSYGYDKYGYPMPVDDFGGREDSGNSSDGNAIAPEAPAGSGGETSTRYSETNIQVEGVDEADVVKTDGDYLYVINSTDLVIYDLSDVNNPVKLSTTSISSNPSEIFIEGNKLVSFGQDWAAIPYESYLSSNGSKIEILTFDISDKTNPVLSQELRLQGSYVTSRMIGDTVYFIANNWFYDYGVTSESIEKYIPLLADRTNREYKKASECNEISYFGSNTNGFVTIAALDLNTESYNTKVLLGDVSNIYMSNENLYLASVKYEYEEEDYNTDPYYYDDIVVRPNIAPGGYRNILSTNTEIFRMSLDKSNMEFSAKGSVEGTVLNQFSMDEHNGNFRIATTINDFNGWGPDSENRLYVLNNSLEEIGKVDGLGLDERIYSTRFMGDRAYMVTFRQVDPLYVIDLSNPSDPKVKGELKIPGFSQYLHPYDENKLIGIGKDADERTGVTKGLKIALFDISDVENPKIQNEILLGSSNSHTEVLNDHKAFLFDKEKELLSIPVTIYSQQEALTQVEVEEIVQNILSGLSISEYTYSTENNQQAYEINNIDSETAERLISELAEEGGIKASLNKRVNSNGATSDVLLISYSSQNSDYPVYDYSGFAVFNITSDELTLRDTIVFDRSEFKDEYYYYKEVTPRSLFVDNNLFMIRDGLLKIVSIDTLSEIFTESIN